VETRRTRPEENRFSPYFRALSHFEMFVSQFYQAFEFLRTVSGEDFFIEGDGSIIEKFYKIYISSKHMDKWIKRKKIPPRSTVPLWITNEGLEGKDGHGREIKLSFSEMYEILGDAAKLAKLISNPKRS
jgi:hypothetical protein